MREKRISFGQGKGSLTHNNREFVADNVDVFRTPDNITFVCQPIGEAYDRLFKESTERYNAKQKRNDRKVHGSYYEHLFGVKPSLIHRSVKHTSVRKVSVRYATSTMSLLRCTAIISSPGTQAAKPFRRTCRCCAGIVI